MLSESGEIIRPQEASPIEQNLRVLRIALPKQIVHVAGMDETSQIGRCQMNMLHDPHQASSAFCHP